MAGWSENTWGELAWNHVAVDVSLSGSEATTATGTVGVSGACNLTLTGVDATVNLGTSVATGGATTALTGSEATTSLGSVSTVCEANVALTGSEATASVGTVSNITDQVLSVSGVEAEALVDDEIGVKADAGIIESSGFEITASLGNEFAFADASIVINAEPPYELVGLVGDAVINASASATVTGVQATASLGNEGTATDNILSVTGVQGTTALGTATSAVFRTVPVTGVEATSAVGSVDTYVVMVARPEGLEATAELGGSVTQHPGTAWGQGTWGQGTWSGGEQIVSVTGLSARTSLGTVRSGVVTFAEVTGVQGTMYLGEELQVTNNIIVETGLQMTGSIGSVSASGSAVVLSDASFEMTISLSNVVVWGKLATDAPSTTWTNISADDPDVVWSEIAA